MKIDFSLAQLRTIKRILGPLPAYTGSDYSSGEAYNKVCEALDSLDTKRTQLEASIKRHENDIASLKAELAAL